MDIDNVEIAPFDNLLVYKKEYTPEIVRQIITEKKLGGLRVFSILKEDRITDIDFLREYEFLERLDITSSRDYSFDFLEKLVNLRKLSINVDGKNKIDVSHLSQLEHLSVKWRNKIVGIENCVRLVSLCLIDYKERDLTKVGVMSMLSELELKTSSIEELYDLGGFLGLKRLSLINCKKLSSIESLDGLNIEYIEIDTCPAIHDFSTLGGLPKLKKIIISECGKIKSIGFVTKLPFLSELSILGNTDIIDGDLMPAKNISSVHYAHRKHYNMKLENHAYAKVVKGNLNLIKKLFN